MTNNTAEMVAIAWGYIIAHRLLSWFQASGATIWPDSQRAIDAAEARSGSRAHLKATVAIASLARLMQTAAGRRIACAHVSGHSSHPWNELADVTAKDSVGLVNPTTTLSDLMATEFCRELQDDERELHEA